MANRLIQQIAADERYTEAVTWMSQRWAKDEPKMSRNMLFGDGVKKRCPVIDHSYHEAGQCVLGAARCAKKS
ncbi:hypothetical protein HNR77_004374 [Paenibacillus sp. JGP012]|uniref:hypothetical protein n=1 Tax=Paenibacillus sp. JGP012 TaxID=2735914 RepID=UPI00161F654A|nr:hypothetical protein [Paenibacillus sp. JGP012]MBB6023274.1 hypothetical protein [Paenibacillus sp. JGP012]